MFVRKKKLVIIVLCCAILWLLISSLGTRSQSKSEDYDEYQSIKEFDEAQNTNKKTRMPPLKVVNEEFEQSLKHAKEKDKLRIKYLNKENVDADYNENMYEEEKQARINKEDPLFPALTSTTLPTPLLIDKWPKADKKENDIQVLSLEKKQFEGQTGVKMSQRESSQFHENMVASETLNGENGQPIAFDSSKLSKHQFIIYEDLLKKYGHNEFISQKISLHRTLPDYRDPSCKSLSYNSFSFKSATVVIAFYNEAWTTLMRTIHSILDRSPANLIKEIVLVDDFSDMEHLKQPLDDYIRLVGKIRIIRTSYRMGVIQARQLGAIDTSSEYIIFLDSHCECTHGWLEPLISRLTEDSNVVVTPIMDIINDDTFAYKSFELNSINIGGFDWNLQFIWMGIPDRIKNLKKSDTDPISSPTMPGGMFAISKALFIKLGGYDSEMNMWGAENLEMSFKIWMCGAKLEIIPCSHVGHLFKRGMSYKLNNSANKRRNYFRLAEIWMDDYKKYFYEKLGIKDSNLDNIGDLVNRKKLRENLQCKNFEWYITNIYPEIFIPSEAIESGAIKNKEASYKSGKAFAACVDAGNSNPNQNKASIWPCHGQGGNQYWMMSKTGEIRRDESCLDYSGLIISVISCHGQRGNQEWIYTREKQIVHKASGMCLALSSDLRQLTMTTCSVTSARQIWFWGDNSHKLSNNIFETITTRFVNDKDLQNLSNEYRGNNVADSNVNKGDEDDLQEIAIP